MISYKILCSAGVLVHGSMPDFLACLLVARDKKAACAGNLPDSHFRVHIYYPNCQRVPQLDLDAAFRALDAVAPGTELGCPTGPSIGQLARRRAVAAQNTPARSAARTAEFCAAAGRGLAVAVDVDFCQAGVVAPPDSPDLGISVCGSAGRSGPFA